MAIMILCIISLRYTPNENPVSLNEQQGDRKKESIFTFASKYKAFIIMTLSVLLAFSFHNMLISYLIHILGDLGGSSADLGKALFIAAIFEIPMMLFSNKILRRISAHRLLAFGAFAYVIRGVMMYFASSVNILLISMTLQMLSFATITCASVHYAEVMMQEEDKVTGQSLMVLAASTSTATGSLSGGLVCDVYGVKNMLIFGTGLSLLAFVVALYSCAMTERKTHTM
ncbi:MAG: MFS transporter [Clostridiales bacterium]|nr:MFS transporter [Clostridiales bacterium]